MIAPEAGTRQKDRISCTRRLWSLWDIMRPFDPVVFLHIRGWTAWYEHFQRELADPSYQRSVRLLRLLPTHRPSLASGGKITDDDRSNFARVYEETENLCVYHELVGARATTRKMQEVLRAPDSKYEELHKLASELKERLIDEMSERAFFSLSLAETVYYSEPRKGWEEIIERFPETIGDIEESRKCFALSRYAGAVFHSLQVVEFGLIDPWKTYRRWRSAIGMDRDD